jgi:hypothetical protein
VGLCRGVSSMMRKLARLIFSAVLVSLYPGWLEEPEGRVLAVQVDLWGLVAVVRCVPLGRLPPKSAVLTSAS